MALEPDLDVLVIGEALIDIVVTTEAIEHVGGSPTNVALGLGRQGVLTALLTQIGDDPRGRRIVDHLAQSGVNVMPRSRRLAHTSIATAHVAQDGHASYEFDITWDALPADDLPPARIVHTGSIATFLQPGAEAVRALLRRTEVEFITYDPNIRPALTGPHPVAVAAFEETAALANVVKMSDEDASWLYPTSSQDDILDRILGLGLDLAVITLGPLGALLATRSTRIHVPGVHTTAVDTIGAGDTFMASLIRSLISHGLPADEEALEETGRSAASAAAITVSRAGADLPWTHEL